MTYSRSQQLYLHNFTTVIWELVTNKSGIKMNLNQHSLAFVTLIFQFLSLTSGKVFSHEPSDEKNFTRNVISAIVKGHASPPRHFFVQVFTLGETYNNLGECGGTVIAPLWVLTSAKCIFDVTHKPSTHSGSECEFYEFHVWDISDVNSDFRSILNYVTFFSRYFDYVWSQAEFAVYRL